MDSNQLTDLFKNVFGKAPEKTEALVPAGSDRRYFRLRAGAESCIGALNPVLDENRAFIYLSRHFSAKGLPVPSILAVSADESAYLQTDLGDSSLFDLLISGGKEAALAGFRQALRELARLQLLGFEGIQTERFFARPVFDATAMRWDLDYAKYYLFRFLVPDLDESAFEADCRRLTQWLEKAERSYFMHRDFQSRNVMVDAGNIHFIDYQGGRLGHPAYDAASMLFQARAGFSSEERADLLNGYIDALHGFSPQTALSLRHYFPGFAWLRVLQTLGAYGYRGLLQQRPHFLSSLDPAIDQAAQLPALAPLPFEMPYISGLLQELAEQKPWHHV